MERAEPLRDKRIPMVNAHRMANATARERVRRTMAYRVRQMINARRAIAWTACVAIAAARRRARRAAPRKKAAARMEHAALSRMAKTLTMNAILVNVMVPGRVISRR